MKKLEVAFPSHLTSLVSEWGSSCPNSFNYIPKPPLHLTPCQVFLLQATEVSSVMKLPSIPPSAPPATLPSPQPGTMRSKDKNFHYLAPLLGVSSFSFFLLSLFFLNALSRSLLKSLFKWREPIRRQAAAIFLFSSPDVLFLSFSRAKRKERGPMPFPLSLTSLLPLISIHQFFRQSAERVSVITALRMDNSLVYSLLKFSSIVWCGEW